MIVDAMQDWLTILPIVIVATISLSLIYGIFVFVSRIWKGN